MKVKFIKQVHGKFGVTAESEDVWLYRLLEMPFVPPVGMGVYEGDWSAVVTGLSYHTADDLVKAWTKQDKSLEHHGNSPPLAEIVEGYLANGWFKEGE